jgi:DNA-binding MarR family transcriptional regulator
MTEQANTGFIDDYMTYLLARASHVMSTAFHREVRAAGLSVMEWRVLASLSGRPPQGIGALADAVLAQQPTLTKLVSRMAEQGLVQRLAHEGDRRQTLVALSARGQKLVAPLLVRARVNESHMLQDLNADEQAALKRQLRLLIARDSELGPHSAIDPAN